MRNVNQSKSQRFFLISFYLKRFSGYFTLHSYIVILILQKTPLKNVTISDSENLYNIRESIHLNVTGTTNHIVEANYHKEDEAADSERSSFTHVTKEIIENNNENSSFRTALNQQESMELNKKCLKWLEGVAKERLQNPDQIILPHLFIT